MDWQVKHVDVWDNPAFDSAEEAIAIQPDDSALKDKAMTTYEQPKDWIERHLVEDPGGLLACEPSRLDTLNEELRLARQANEAQHQQLAALNEHQIAYETQMEQQLAAKDALIAELQKAVNLIYSWARNWDSEFMNDPEWKDSDFPLIQLIMKQSGKEQGK